MLKNGFNSGWWLLAATALIISIGNSIGINDVHGESRKQKKEINELSLKMQTIADDRLRSILRTLFRIEEKLDRVLDLGKMDELKLSPEDRKQLEDIMKMEDYCRNASTQHLR